MRIRWLLGATVVAVAVGFVAGRGFGDEKEAGQPDDAQMDEMMKLAQPGPEHKWLQELVGSWDVVAKLWFGPEPTEHKGTARFESILGGRFIRQSYLSQMEGMPFEGMGLLGYSNVEKQYQAWWFDTWSTGAVTYTASYDAEKKILNMTGSQTMTTGKVTTREELSRPDANTMVMKAWHAEGGKEQQVMEITYRRK